MQICHKELIEEYPTLLNFTFKNIFVEIPSTLLYVAAWPNMHSFPSPSHDYGKKNYGREGL